MQDIKAGWILLRCFSVAKHLYVANSKNRFWEEDAEGMGSPVKPHKTTIRETLRKKFIVFFK